MTEKIELAKHYVYKKVDDNLQFTVHYFLPWLFFLYLTIPCICLNAVTPISDKDKMLAPKNKPRYDPQSAIKVEKSANLISSFIIVVAVSGKIKYKNVVLGFAQENIEVEKVSE